MILEVISKLLGLLVLVLLSHEYFLNESEKLLREVLRDQLDDILMILALLGIINCVHVGSDLVDTRAFSELGSLNDCILFLLNKGLSKELLVVTVHLQDVF